MGRRAGQLRDGVRRHLPLAALGAGFFAYAAARAWLVPITWDEAYSYLEFTRTGALSPFEFPPLAANNHFLNTWLTWVTARVFGPSELSLRLPALGGQLLFLYYSARLCARWEPLLLGCAAFVVLNANPYVLDFFALSRGYGIAYGLMAGSIWHLNRHLEAGLRIRSAVASVAFALLAVAAHLTLLHFALAVLAVVVAAPALLGGERLPLGARLVAALRRTAVPIALAMAFLVPTALVVRGLRRVEAFYYGGEASFWHDTIVTVFDSSLYERDYLAAVGGPPGALSHLLGVLAVFTLVIAGWQSIQLVSRRPWGACCLPAGSRRWRNTSPWTCPISPGEPRSTCWCCSRLFSWSLWPSWAGSRCAGARCSEWQLLPRGLTCSTRLTSPTRSSGRHLRTSGRWYRIWPLFRSARSRGRSTRP
jgi:hypothetical protein